MISIDEKWLKELQEVEALLKKSSIQASLARKEDKVLTLGVTGAGKSTFLNYLNGVRYEVGSDESGGPIARCISGNELAKTGQEMDSQTLFPQVIKKKGLNYVYCDLAGFGENRGLLEKICAANNAQIISTIPGKIKALLVIVDIQSFSVEKGKSFRETSTAIATMIKRNVKVLDNIYFVITKVPKGAKTTPALIIKKYFRGILGGKEGLEAQLKSRELQEDEKNLLFLLQAMEKREKQILIPDVTDEGESRSELEDILSKMASIEASSFNFLEHDETQKEFNEKLLKMAKEYLEVSEQINYEIPNRLREEEGIKQELNLKELTLSLEKLKLTNELQNCAARSKTLQTEI